MVQSATTTARKTFTGGIPPSGSWILNSNPVCESDSPFAFQKPSGRQLSCQGISNQNFLLSQKANAIAAFVERLDQKILFNRSFFQNQSFSSRVNSDLKIFLLLKVLLPIKLLNAIVEIRFAMTPPASPAKSPRANCCKTVPGIAPISAPRC